MDKWLFTLGDGFFTQQRWYWVHVCGWTSKIKQRAPRRVQSRTGIFHGQRRM